MLGSDRASDVVPSRIEGIDFPVQLLTLHAIGIHIFDNCDLQVLSQTPEKLKQSEFLLSASPLAFPGGTESPLNPIATY